MGALGALALIVLVAVSAGGASGGHASRGGAGAGGQAASAATLPPPHVEHVSRYGGLPSWLPKSKAPVGRTLEGSAGRPAVTLQGEAVSVELSSGSVLATAVGPSVPQTGLTPPPETTPATFVVTLARATVPVHLDAAAFSAIDESGHVHALRMRGLKGAPPPATVPPGQPVTFELHAVLPTGDGALRWAPEGKPVASWDFNVEID